MAHTVHKIGNTHTPRAKGAEGSPDGMIFIFVIIVFVLFILIKRGSPGRKGRRAEEYVSRNFLKLDPSRYKILNDVMLPSRGNSATTQIDHIVISNHGIFCIETKAHKGWIFGNAHQEYWTQIIFRYKGRFYNPLRQNYAHTRAMEDLLGARLLKRKIVSLIAFPNADKLVISGTDSVGGAHEILRTIESYVGLVYSDAERDEIYHLLEDSNISDDESRELHIREVRDLKRY